MPVEFTQDDQGNTVAKITSEKTPYEIKEIIEAKPRIFDELAEQFATAQYAAEEQATLQGCLIFATEEIERLENNADKRLKEKNRKLETELKAAAEDLKFLATKYDDIEKKLQAAAWVIQQVRQRRARKG